MSTTGPGFRRAWGHTRWRWLLGSFAVSSTGDFLYDVALIVFIIEATDSPTWIAASVVVRMLAYVVLSPMAGVVADRYDRRRLLVSLDVVRAVLMAVLALIAWVDGSPVLAIAVMVASSAATAPSRPATVAATPLLVSEDDLAAANAAESIVFQLGFFVGPALGAGLVALAGPGPAFLANGVTFLLSALLLARVGDIGGGRRAVSDPGADDPEHLDPTDGGGIAEGIHVIRRVPGLATLVGLMTMSVVVFGFEDVVHVLIAEDRLGMDPSAVGVLAAATAVGGLLAAPVTARLAAGRSPGLLLVGAGVLSGVAVALLAITRTPALALVLLAVEGVGIIVFEVLSMTLLQRSCSEGVLGRVYGLVDAAGAAGQMAGSLSAPILLGALNLEAGLWIIGLAMAAVSLMSLPSIRAMATRTRAQRDELRPTTEVLARTPVFADIPQAGLERLARQLRPRSIAAGTVVVTEGDPADDVYVVESGELIVMTHRDGEVNRMGPGDVFGEIGLVRDIPRTATVKTVGDCALLVIAGRAFLDAVSGTGPLPDPLLRLVSHRLGRTHPWLEGRPRTD